MKIFNEWLLRFDHPNWASSPEYGLIDSILETHPHLINLLKKDIIQKEKENDFGRKDTPTVEQIVRAAIFKEMKGMDYRELEYAQEDSKICEMFIKLDQRHPFSFQLLQKYISRISVDSLHELLVEVNKIGIEEGFEDVSKLRQDSTVVKTNIHYPTNNSLIWDCIRVSHRLLEALKKEESGVNYIDYIKGAKKTYYKINVTKTGDKRQDLFQKQLITFTKTINQVSNILKKKARNVTGLCIQMELRELLEDMKRIYDISWRKEIMKESIPNEEKLFSIFERHTDIIVKGSRDVLFGHKVNLATGKSDLILDIQSLKGNPSDTNLYQSTIDRVINHYGIIPRDSTTDGGYASLANQKYSQEKGIVNIVFNKIVGSLQNKVSSKNLETRLKKWRSGIEANISNWKRGFNIRVCAWKGWSHFQAKILWSALGYNFRVLTALAIGKLEMQRLQV
jgi:transposase, IS5 family